MPTIIEGISGGSAEVLRAFVSLGCMAEHDKGWPVRAGIQRRLSHHRLRMNFKCLGFGISGGIRRLGNALGP